MSNEKNNKHNARAHNNFFTIAQLSRDLNIDAKIARRRMRDARKRNDERIEKIDQRQRETYDDSRVKHEYANEHIDVITSIITNER